MQAIESKQYVPRVCNRPSCRIYEIEKSVVRYTGVSRYETGGIKTERSEGTTDRIVVIIAMRPASSMSENSTPTDCFSAAADVTGAAELNASC